MTPHTAAFLESENRGLRAALRDAREALAHAEVTGLREALQDWNRDCPCDCAACDALLDAIEKNRAALDQQAEEREALERVARAAVRLSVVLGEGIAIGGPADPARRVVLTEALSGVARATIALPEALAARLAADTEVRPPTTGTAREALAAERTGKE